ncbi:cell division protein FtsQ/DivIB [Thermodesulfobacteriota bacterium]
MIRRLRKKVRSGKPKVSGETDAVERAQRNRVVLKSILVGCLSVNVILGLLLLYVVFLHIPYFNLQCVDVSGNRHLAQEELIEAAEIEGGINLLTVNLNTIAERLKKHPWIRSASVYRKLPGRLIMEIQERSPRAILAASKLYYVDEQGEVFTRLLPGNSVNYPLFTGVTPEQLDSKGPEVREMIRKGLGLLELAEGNRSTLSPSTVSEIRISLDEGLTLRTSCGRTIVLGKVDFEGKLHRYGRLKRFLTRRGEWNNARIIDLDFEDRALVRSAGARFQG